MMNKESNSTSLPHSQDAQFWDKAADKYSRRPVGNQALYEKKLALTQKYLGPDSEVLEFGCGTGSTALIHAAHVKRIVASDISTAMIEIAKRKQLEQGVTNVEFLASTFWDLESEPESFDAVVALNILHLLEDYREHIARSYELLKPGGVFVSSTACVTSPIFRIIIGFMRVFKLAPTVVFLSAADLEQTMVDHGFEIVDGLNPDETKRSRFLIARKPE